jgi:hypothetical protein
VHVKAPVLQNEHTERCQQREAREPPADANGPDETVVRIASQVPIAAGVDEVARPDLRLD